MWLQKINTLIVNKPIEFENVAAGYNEFPCCINSMLCPVIIDRNTIELIVHTSCCLGLRLTLCYLYNLHCIVFLCKEPHRNPTNKHQIRPFYLKNKQFFKFTKKLLIQFNLEKIVYLVIVQLQRYDRKSPLKSFKQSLFQKIYFYQEALN